jgi:cytochrome c biogenesis protein CcdA
MGTIFYTLTISLFDSISTTQQIIIFMLLLTTAKPLKNAFSYLVGLSGAYFVCGVAGYLTLDSLRVWLGYFFPSTDSMSNPLYYRTEFLTGLVMSVLGVWYFYRKKQGKQDPTENMIFARLRTMNSLFAFYVGLFISVTSFPVSIPYLIALGKYSSLHLGLLAATEYILLYNVGYALPMILLFFVYLIARRNADDYKDTMHEKAKKLNVRLTTWTLVGFGLFSMIDAGCYFTIGHALMKGRYF